MSMNKPAHTGEILRGLVLEALGLRTADAETYESQASSPSAFQTSPNADIANKDGFAKVKAIAKTQQMERFLQLPSTNVFLPQPQQAKALAHQNKSLEP
jgi:hypothetical protein